MLFPISYSLTDTVLIIRLSNTMLTRHLLLLLQMYVMFCSPVLHFCGPLLTSVFVGVMLRQLRRGLTTCVVRLLMAAAWYRRAMIHLVQGTGTIDASWRLATWSRVIYAFLIGVIRCDSMHHPISINRADFAFYPTHVLRVIKLRHWSLLWRPRIAVAMLVSLITVRVHWKCATGTLLDVVNFNRNNCLSLENRLPDIFYS